MLPPPLAPAAPEPALLTAGTINLIVTITLFMQGIFIAASTRVIKSYRGVWQAAIATITLASGFLIITLLASPTGNRAALFGSQFLFVCGNALIYWAICSFVERPFNKWILLGFVPASLVALVIEAAAMASPGAFRLTSVAAGLVLFASASITLWTSDHRRYKLSARFTAVTLAGFAAAMLVQLIAGFFSVGAALPIGNSTEKYASLMFFIFSYLWTGGFILMVSQRLQSDLNELAMNDALTQAHNRRAMDHLLDAEMESVHKEARDFSIVLIDIDHFKKINDTYGHDVGDDVLQWFAATLQSYMRAQDVVARWGGEEFLVLLPDTSLKDAEKIAERLRVIIEASQAEVPEGTVRVTVSAGVSSSDVNRDVGDLCRVADQALYVAKQARNRVATQNDLEPSVVRSV